MSNETEIVVKAMYPRYRSLSGEHRIQITTTTSTAREATRAYDRACRLQSSNVTPLIQFDNQIAGIEEIAPNGNTIVVTAIIDVLTFLRRKKR